MKPTVRRLEEEYKGKVTFKPLNVDDTANDEAKLKLKFLGQPQFVILNAQGDIHASLNGMQTYDILKGKLEEVIAK